VLGASGCGGGGAATSGDRAKLQSQIYSGLTTANEPADLASCVAEHAGSLPLADERRLASTIGPGKTQDTAPGQAYPRLVTQCVAQGKGVDVFRRIMVAGVVRKLPSTAPAYRSCMGSKLSTITPQQLSAAMERGGLTEAAGRQLGSGLAAECAAQPAVGKELRAVFAAKVGAGLTRYSPAFRACVVRKIRHIPTDVLKMIVAEEATQSKSAAGESFGRLAARQCVAEGARP
jgi:hypothetical protein